MAEGKYAAEIAGTRWSPDQYTKYSDQRLRPALELLERVPIESPRLIVDLGCGTGNVTQIIAERWKSAQVFGLDNSKEMLQEARSKSGRVQWVEADIEDWLPQDPPDLIYSNAALHWVKDHRHLFPRLVGFLGKGGCLAVQMPLSWGARSHRLMRETLSDGGLGGAPLGTETLRRAVAKKWVEPATVYYDLLASRARNLDIWETEYLQVLSGEDSVLEWVKGTGLRPILNGLAESERDVFLDEYRRRLRKAYPVKPDGRTLYPFRRLFIVAQV